ALKTVISFLVGAVCSGLAGYTGMYCSIRANIRTASAARTSLNKALQMALRGGAVTGLVVVALSLLGVGALFLFFGGVGHSGTWRGHLGVHSGRECWRDDSWRGTLSGVWCEGDSVSADCAGDQFDCEYRRRLCGEHDRRRRSDACVEQGILCDVGACAGGVCCRGLSDAEWSAGAVAVASGMR